MDQILASPTRKFVDHDFDAGSLPACEALFERLQSRPIESVADLEQWLLDESELTSCIGAELARRYIAMTRATDDAEAREAYVSFERDVMPRVKVLSDRLDKRFLSCPHAAELDPARYEVLLLKRRTRSAIFREANTELQKREAELQTRHQETMAALTVSFDGKQLTLQQLAPYMEEQDRSLREGAFRAGIEARRRTWGAMEDVFDELVAIRTAMAANAGHASYIPFRFLELQRFDYAEEDCRQFHASVERHVVPAVRELNRRRAAALRLEALRPWDVDVDPEGSPPLKPFSTERELIDLARGIFGRVDPRFAREFDVLVERDLLDLMSRKGKAPGGYQYALEDERVPFIFANAAGLHRDVQTLLHEGGHAFHTLLSRHLDLSADRDCWIEFAETTSMSMELMGLERLAPAYAPADAARARRQHLEGILRVLVWIASIDAFQLHVYAHPDEPRDARREAWLAIRRRFSTGVDWSTFEDALAMQWIGQIHLFHHPLYYVEYGIAQLAALQIWREFRRDPGAAVESYRSALSLGGSKRLPELFAAAGILFDFSEAMVGELVAEVVRELPA
ncbi:MAG: M3 family oligoendopeptidase [Planctomycetota bacterium]